MNIIMIIGIIVVVVGVVVVLLSKNKDIDVPGADRARFVDPMMNDEYRKFGPTSVAPGAIIGHQGHDYVVRGSVEIAEGPFRWWEHLLDGGENGRWFGVEEDEGEVILTWWQRQPGSFQPTNPIIVGGVEYWEKERGRAMFKASGTTGLPPAGSVEYIDFASDNGQLLGLERYSSDSAWEASLGRRVLPGELKVMSAPDHNPGRES